jgi:hypothetical protein
MASAREEAAAHRRAPAASKLARAPVVRAVSSGRQRPAEGVGGYGQDDRLEVAAAEGRIGCATQQRAECRGDPGLDQAKA